MSKAAVSYYPSYIERDAIHEIDPTINVKDITAYVFDEFKSDIQEDFAKRNGLLFVGGLRIRRMQTRCSGLQRILPAHPSEDGGSRPRFRRNLS